MRHHPTHADTWTRHLDATSHTPCAWPPPPGAHARSSLPRCAHASPLQHLCTAVALPRRAIFVKLPNAALPWHCRHPMRCTAPRCTDGRSGSPLVCPDTRPARRATAPQGGRPDCALCRPHALALYLCHGKGGVASGRGVGGVPRRSVVVTRKPASAAGALRGACATTSPGRRPAWWHHPRGTLARHPQAHPGGQAP